MARNMIPKLALSAGCVSSPVAGLEAAILGVQSPGLKRIYSDQIAAIPIEAIRRLPTRSGTLADALRTLVSAEDLKDPDAAARRLVELVRRTGSKATASRIRRVLRQMMDEAGL